MIAKKYGHTKEALDAYSVEVISAVATQETQVLKEIVAIMGRTADGGTAASARRGIRDDASMEAMAQLKILMDDGARRRQRHQICDGSSAVMVASAQAKTTTSRHWRAFITSTVTAGDPVIMLRNLFATDRALKRAGMSIHDLDLYEVNEAFAPVPMAWLEHTGADPDKLNVNGGAIALGHPLGATGTKLMTTLVHALHARGKKWGLQTMCEGGGIANVTIIEAL